MRFWLRSSWHGLASARVSARSRRLFAEIGLLPALLVALIVAFAAFEPRFMSGENWFNILRQANYLMLVAMGQMVVLIAGHLDLSVGATMALTSVVVAMVMTTSGVADNAWVAMAAGALAGLGVGLAIGLVNGLAVAVFRVSSFMVTLGMSSIAFGIALLLSSGVPVVGLPPEFTRGLGTGALLGVPVPVVITAVSMVVLYLFLEWTRYGRYIYAVGANARAAHLAGIRTLRVTVGAFVICGLLASLSGVLLTARVSSGEANLGAEFVLISIAAAVLGGTSLYGGQGRLAFVAVGVLFVAVLANGMNLVRVESYTQQLVLGFILIVAVVIDRLRSRSAGGTIAQ